MPVSNGMKKILPILIAFPLLISSCYAQPADSHFTPIAVVELFTSEGCSSCPPADVLLTKLNSEAARDHKKIYPLSFHVDYWDRLGWKDPFSSSVYSDRQRQYAQVMDLQSVYTPQIVVNGSAELVGSDESRLNAAVSHALQANTKTAFTKLAVKAKEGNKITLSYTLSGDYKNCDIHFALVSKHESTAVKRGENGGRQLTHTNVVRQFLSRAAESAGEIVMDSSSISDFEIVAYVQHTTDLRIIAAAELNP